MNIFVLDENPKIAAQYHCDKHVIKMILESVQMINTAINISYNAQIGYKSAHVNHPCAIWVRESLSNIVWLYRLTKQLNYEYRYRFNKKRNHASWDHLLTLPKPNILDIGLTPFRLAMPENIKIQANYDPVLAYRLYYIQNKSHILKYTKRPMPNWISGENI